MAAVTICSDFGAPKNIVWHCFQFPHLFPMKWWDQMPSFSKCWALSQLFHSPLSLSSRGFLVPLVNSHCKLIIRQLKIHRNYEDKYLDREGKHTISLQNPFWAFKMNIDTFAYHRYRQYVIQDLCFSFLL